MGPFESPLPNSIISPLGLVPKKDRGQYRLIHDLSFPRNNSVNSHIDPVFTAVSYELLDHCIDIIVKLGKGCWIAKADLKDAFRILPIHPSDYRLLGFTWQGKYYYDRSLPMGCSISCRLFEDLSSAVQWILMNKFRVIHMSHILDDFIFFAPTAKECDISLSKFFLLAESVNLPIKEEKTVHTTTSPILHGITVDTINMELRLPEDKVQDCIVKLQAVRFRKKVTVRTIQSLLGSLNFACRAIVPGRTFLRRIIDLTQGHTNPIHFININSEARKDFELWLSFLSTFNGRRMCPSNIWTTSNALTLTSYASALGCGAILGKDWFQLRFPDSWSHFHISVKELLPIVMAIHVWGERWQSKRIIFQCDNSAVVEVINKLTSKDKHLMALSRRLVMATLTFNIDFKAQHICGKSNVVCDAISRFRLQQARQVAPWLAEEPHPVPNEWHTWCL